MQILGGGPAGLSAAYYAKKMGMEFELLEASGKVGGNCRTLRVGDFLFDTGAHRLHDKDPQVTEEIQGLLGKDLFEVGAPSEIFSGGKFFRFPLRAGNLVRHLDKGTLARIVSENLSPRKRNVAEINFEQFALARYGPSLARKFLLNYSTKLWGEEPRLLLPEVAGGRLRDLDFFSVVREALFLGKRRSQHLDGSFLYPRHGIGMIADRVSECIGSRRIRLNNRVTQLSHSNGRITRITVNGKNRIDARTVVNTLPLNLVIHMISPPPPQELLEAATSIKYRHMVLCVFCLDRPFFSPNASIYFPDSDFPFTRLYEPKRRSPHMAPESQTAIVLEIPCYREDPAWQMTAEELSRSAWEALQKVKVIPSEDVLHFKTVKLPFAYPVLEVRFAEIVHKLLAYLERFENLHMTGRSSLFRYLHIHDLFKAGRELMTEITSSN